MKNIKLVIILLIFASVSCINKPKNIKPQKVVFEKIKSVKLPLGDNSIFVPYNNSYSVIDNIETLIIYRRDKRKLVFYDINNKKIYNQINLGFSQLYSYKYISKDSIFLFYVNQLNPNNYVDDKQLQLVDFNGKIKKTYHYNNKNIWSDFNQPLSKYDAYYPALLGNKISYFDNNIFMFLNRIKRYNIGTDSFFIKKSPIVAYYNTINKKLIPSKKLWFPYIKKGDYYPSDFNYINYCLTSDNQPLIRFYYSANLFKWNYKKDSISVYNLKSRLLDTIPPLDYPIRSSDNNINAMYQNITYDKYRELYYSILYFSPDFYGSRVWSLIVADKNFNYLGEVLLPKLNTFIPAITKDYLLSVRVAEKGYFYLDYYKIKFKNVDYDKYILNLKNKLKNKKDSIIRIVCEIAEDTSIKSNKAPILNYLKNKMKIKDKKYAVISIYEHAGCPSCKTKVLRFIGRNKDILEKNNVYLNISGNSLSSIYYFLSKDFAQNYNNRYNDTLNQYILFDSFNNKNPRLTLVRNDSIISDKIYNPADIPNLIQNILDFTNLKKE